MKIKFDGHEISWNDDGVMPTQVVRVIGHGSSVAIRHCAIVNSIFSLRAPMKDLLQEFNEMFLYDLVNRSNHFAGKLLVKDDLPNSVYILPPEPQGQIFKVDFEDGQVGEFSLWELMNFIVKEEVQKGEEDQRVGVVMMSSSKAGSQNNAKVYWRKDGKLHDSSHEISNSDKTDMLNRIVKRFMVANQAM